MASAAVIAPGIAAAAVVMAAGFWLAGVAGDAVSVMLGLTGGSPVSGVAVAIVLGVLLRLGVPLPGALDPGLRFCVGTVLRAGIVCVGIKLSALEVLALGVAGVPAVMAAIATGLLFVPWLNRRLGLPSRLGTLLAAGTSVCGVTAIVATAPAIDADERDVAYAVANVVAFGFLGMLTYPYLAHVLLGRPEAVGLFLGTAVHDTSQVVGAALTYAQVYGDDAALRVAMVTKLTRNLSLAGVIPLLTWMHARTAGSLSGAAGRPTSWTAWVPAFVVGFVGMAVLRSIGDATLASGGSAFGFWSETAWAAVTHEVGETLGARVLLGTAMAAVGLSTRVSVFSGVGMKPFIVGFAGALVVGAVGLAMAALLGGFVRM